MKFRSPVAALFLILGACGANPDVPDSNCTDPDDAADQMQLVAWPVILGTVAEWDGTTASLIVEEVWRGFDVAARVDVVAEPGRAYTVGVQYLVFPANREPPFLDTPCSATTRFTAELADLRPNQVRVILPDPARDADLPWEWVTAALLLAAAYRLTRWIVAKRRYSEPLWNPDHHIDHNE